MTLGDHESQDINILPNELLIHIFKYLPLETLICCENVCSRWRKLATDPDIWRRLEIIYSEKKEQTEMFSKNLQVIKSHPGNIFRLKLQYIRDCSTIGSVLDNCNNITSLELVMCTICKHFEEQISRWPNLKRLNLKNSLLKPGDADLSIKYDQCKHLEYLALSDFGLNSSNCDSLLGCNYLRHINIEKIKNLKLDYIEKLILAKQKMLVTFHFHGGEAVNDKILQLLSKCSLLKDLTIIRCEGLTDKGLAPLADLKHLERLQIWNNSKFTEQCLLITLSHPNLISLRELSLSRIDNITPCIVDVISEYYKDLKFLALYQCHKVISTDYEKQLHYKFRNINVVLY